MIMEKVIIRKNIEERINVFIEAIMKVARENCFVSLEIPDDLNYPDVQAMGINIVVDNLKKRRETELENDRIKRYE